MGRKNKSLEMLRNIWNEMKAVNGKIDKTNSRLDELRTDLGDRIDKTNERIDALGANLGARIDATNLRLDKVEVRLGQVESAVKEVSAQHKWLNAFVANTHEKTQERLDALEAPEGH